MEVAAPRFDDEVAILSSSKAVFLCGDALSIRSAIVAAYLAGLLGREAVVGFGGGTVSVSWCSWIFCFFCKTLRSKI